MTRLTDKDLRRLKRVVECGSVLPSSSRESEGYRRLLAAGYVFSHALGVRPTELGRQFLAGKNAELASLEPSLRTAGVEFAVDLAMPLAKVLMECPYPEIDEVVTRGERATIDQLEWAHHFGPSLFFRVRLSPEDGIDEKEAHAVAERVRLRLFEHLKGRAS